MAPTTASSAARSPVLARSTNVSNGGSGAAVAVVMLWSSMVAEPGAAGLRSQARGARVALAPAVAPGAEDRRQDRQLLGQRPHLPLEHLVRHAGRLELGED